MGTLIDSNILIYSYLNEYQYLREVITADSSFISEISRIEVLGYHGLKKEEELYFSDVFNFVPVITPSQEVFDKAITIRRAHNLKLGDSLIAATAIVYELTLYTRNIADFDKVSELKMINPII